ncbi:MAG: STAS domain-containing protein [Algisphaera sp.]
MADELCLDLEQQGCDLMIRLPGPDISGANMESVTVTCAEHMRFDHACNFALDLAQVEYLDSACIGHLVELLREIEPMRGRIALVNCRPNVTFLFKSTQLDTIFGLFDDMDDAIASFTKRDHRR